MTTIMKTLPELIVGDVIVDIDGTHIVTSTAPHSRLVFTDTSPLGRHVPLLMADTNGELHPFAFAIEPPMGEMGGE